MESEGENTPKDKPQRSTPPKLPPPDEEDPSPQIRNIPLPKKPRGPAPGKER